MSCARATDRSKIVNDTLGHAAGDGLLVEVAVGCVRIFVSVEIATVEYAFVAKESITIEAGETIEFVVTNEGEINHEMEVLTDASRRLGKTEEIAPGTRSPSR